MVTKTTKTPATPVKKSPTEALAAARAARERASKNDTFTYCGKVKEGAKKLAPQAQNIVNILQAKKGKPLTREALVAAMNGVVESKQPLSRILAYYQKELSDNGHVIWTQAPKEDKPEKPAKEPTKNVSGDADGDEDEEESE
jgi:hypothetical protein